MVSAEIRVRWTGTTGYGSAVKMAMRESPTEKIFFTKNSVAERVANMVPDAIDTLSGIISKKKNADNVTVESAEPAIIEKVPEEPVQE